MGRLTRDMLTCLLTALLVISASTTRAAERNVAGAATRGGDERPEVVVHSLNDAGPGTLRAALEQGDCRVAFRVAGAIRLRSALVLKRANTTIDGASAPPPGISIVGKPCVIRDTHDVIVRHVRFRDSDDDNLRIQGRCRNVQIDHCSSVRPGDGAIDITEDYKTHARPEAITVSWCVMGGAEKAMLISSAANVSLHHNLFTNNAQRSPQLHDVEGFEFRQNVVRYWHAYGMRVRGRSRGNVVGNVFAASANRRKKPELALVVVRPEGDLAAPELFAAGNLGIDGFDPNALGGAKQPLGELQAIMASADGVEAAVVGQSGVRPLDEHDRPFVEEPQTAAFRPATTK